MSENKRAVRRAFRDSTWKRDGYRCVCCGFRSSPATAEQELDAHHITPREDMPNGGYVKENGITLCKGEDGSSCHEKAEMVLKGRVIAGFSPNDLYSLIGSSKDKALLNSLSSR